MRSKARMSGTAGGAGADLGETFAFSFGSFSFARENEKLFRGRRSFGGLLDGDVLLDGALLPPEEVRA